MQGLLQYNQYNNLTEKSKTLHGNRKYIVDWNWLIC